MGIEVLGAALRPAIVFRLIITALESKFQTSTFDKLVIDGPTFVQFSRNWTNFDLPSGLSCPREVDLMIDFS